MKKNLRKEGRKIKVAKQTKKNPDDFKVIQDENKKA